VNVVSAHDKISELRDAFCECYPDQVRKAGKAATDKEISLLLSVFISTIHG
jgi:hypothetical protein